MSSARRFVLLPPALVGTALLLVTLAGAGCGGDSGGGQRCAARRGGAFVAFDICDESLIVWSTAPAFIDEAIRLLDSGERLIPVFAQLLDGTDCDPQWTWHVGPAEMSFTEFAIELCDGCPSHLDDDKAYWLNTVRQYCPWTARVVDVDDRRG